MAHYKGAASEAGRAQILLKKRQKEQEELEVRKKKIEEEMRIGSIHNKFATHYDAIEQQLKSDTVGLVTLDEMKAKQENVIRKREAQLAKKNSKARLVEEEKRRQKHREKLKISNLSFDPNEEEEEEEDDDDDDKEDEKKNDNDDREDEKKDENDETEIVSGDVDADEEPEEKKRRRFGKNPDVDTSFLPDRDREQEENQLREKLREEWSVTQERIKTEEIEITYSYWDGSGHRRQCKMKKGNSIQQFLQRCLEMLRKEFNDLKAVTVDQLMYVKEDLIIAQHYTFYDFIVTKARGKSGPLFSFDAHEDVRIVNDASVAKDESHAGKVCLRSWYERHKHIFPASRWEPYDPEKKWDQYTVADKNAVKITVK